MPSWKPSTGPAGRHDLLADGASWYICFQCNLLPGQNLKIKAFIGNSENAVLSQIYAALIVYLLLCYTKFLCNLNVALQHFMRILQLNLFRTCSLQELFEPPGPVPDNMSLLRNTS